MTTMEWLWAFTGITMLLLALRFKWQEEQMTRAEIRKRNGARQRAAIMRRLRNP